MIVIKDMKMPSSCYDCPFVKNERTNDYGSFCECGVLEDYETINLLEHSKHPNCPLVEQESIMDEVKAEIEQLPTTLIEVQRSHSTVVRNGVELDSVLRIFDKYKVGSEDKEEQLKKLKAELDYAKFRCTLQSYHDALQKQAESEE